MNAVYATGNKRAFEEKVTGFVDTLKLYRNTCPSAPSRKLEELCKDFGMPKFHAHNANADAQALKQLVKKTRPDIQEVEKASMTTKCCIEIHDFKKNRDANYITWTTVVADKGITKEMAGM